MSDTQTKLNANSLFHRVKCGCGKVNQQSLFRTHFASKVPQMKWLGVILYRGNICLWVRFPYGLINVSAICWRSCTLEF